MRSLGGFVLLAGIGVGLFVYFPAPVDRSTSLEEATRATQLRAAEQAVRPAPSVNIPNSSRVASFAPSTALQAPTHPSPVAAATPSVAPAAKVEAIANWQTTVAQTGSGSLEPADPDSRYKLVVDIQQHLKRVGCYWGRVNGSWTSSTREAMREFTSHANAALPADKPDYLLLSLLKGHNGKSCGATEATVAKAPEVLPWKAASTDPQQPTTRLFTPVPTSVVTTEPLPGRMSIGAPLPPAAQEPLVPGGAPTSRNGTATAALDPSMAGPGTAAVGPPAAAPKPRASKKSSGSWRKPSPGTPRYNLMLSLGGVY